MTTPTPERAPAGVVPGAAAPTAPTALPGQEPAPVPSAATAATAVPTNSRALAPDLARGLMLLLIALANVPWFLYGAELSGVGAQRSGTTGLDAAWQTVSIIAVDGRSYPLFAFLFGYGIWQLYSRQQARGTAEPAARRLLQTRHALLVLFGAVHAALLWYGDVMGAYGLAGLVVVWLFLRRGSKTLVVWSIVLMAVLTLVAVLSLLGGLFTPPDLAAETEMSLPSLAGIESYPESVLPRLGFWVVLALGQGLLTLVVPVMVLLALVVARRRVLEEPDRHRTLLVRTAVIGIPIGWLGAVPSVLVHHDVWQVPSWTPLVLGSVTGPFAALGYVAVFALLAARVQGATRDPGLVARGLTAVGKRSMSCYVFQSVVLGPLLCAWGLGLGGVVGPTQAALIAVATWLASVVLALLLERAGRRGPAEWLLRRLAYRGDASAATPVTDRLPVATTA